MVSILDGTSLAEFIVTKRVGGTVPLTPPFELPFSWGVHMTLGHISEN